MEAWALPGWAGRPRRASARIAQARPGPLAPAPLHAGRDPHAPRLRRQARRRPRALTALPAGPAPAGATGRCCWSASPAAGAVARAARGRGRGDPRRARRHPRPRPRRRPGRGPASARRTCATRCGRPATASDTLETATDWAHVPGAARPRSRRPLGNALAPVGERVHVFTHLSHLYPSGSSLYLTYMFRLARGPGRDAGPLAGDQARGLGQTIVAEGATISHHHGVGTDHAPYLAAEKGPLGMAALEADRPHLRPRRDDEPGRPALGPARGAADERGADDRGPAPRASTSARRASGRWCSTRPATSSPARRSRSSRTSRARPAAASRTRSSTGARSARRCHALWAAARGVAGTRSPAWRSRPSAAPSWSPTRLASRCDGRWSGWTAAGPRACRGSAAGGGSRSGRLGVTETVATFQAEAEANVLARDEPETWARIRHYLLLSGFLVHRLTGRFVDSRRRAGRLPPVRLQGPRAGRSRGDWKWQAVPVEREWLPELVPPGGRLGHDHGRRGRGDRASPPACR